MAEGGGFEPPEGVNILRFSRPPQSAALPSLRRPFSWRHENGGASGTRTHVAAVQRRSSPAELWPRENHGRSGGDRTRDHLLPKQVRCRCATLRCCYLALPCTALPCRAVPCHTLASIAPLCLAKQNLKGRDPDDHGPGPVQVKTACLVQHRQFSGPQSRQRQGRKTVAAGQGGEFQPPSPPPIAARRCEI